MEIVEVWKEMAEAVSREVAVEGSMVGSIQKVSVRVLVVVSQFLV